MDSKKAIILEDSAFFKRGQVLDVTKVDEGALSPDGRFINESALIFLEEKMSLTDETRVRELIRQALKGLFWQLYSKQNQIIT